MNKVVLVDLDSTLYNTKHRDHLAPEDREDTQNWVPYSMACFGDTVVESVKTVVNMLAKDHLIFIVSGRNNEAYAQTVYRLLEDDVTHDIIRLHTQHDLRNNAEFKVAYLHKLQSLGYEVVLFIEDQVSVAEAIEEAGVPVLVVNPRYEDKIGVAFNHVSSS